VGERRGREARRQNKHGWEKKGDNFARNFKIQHPI
jgi:hypothetical protein